MKRTIYILENILIFVIISISILIFVKFIYHITHENIDTNYMWNISYTDFIITEGSKNGKVENIDNSVKLDVTLEKEEEFFEFSLNIRNDGNLNAQIDNLVKEVESTNNILVSKIMYSDGTDIKKGDILESKSIKKIIFRIDYPKQKEKIYDPLNLKMNFKIEFKPKL